MLLRPLFDDEGKKWPCDDKATFLNCIADTVDVNSELQRGMDRNCIIIDGLGFVNQLAMKNMVTLADLNSQFTERLNCKLNSKVTSY